MKYIQHLIGLFGTVLFLVLLALLGLVCVALALALLQFNIPAALAFAIVGVLELICVFRACERLDRGLPVLGSFTCR